MMSSASTPDFMASLRRQQRRPHTPSLGSSSSTYDLSARASSAPPVAQQTATPVQPNSRTLDPTFEPLERAGRSINDGIRKDDRFPELDQLVQRIP